MRRGKAKVQKENNERWLLTYSDLITLLMIFFIILYAMSSTDSRKFQDLTGALQAAFNNGAFQLITVGGTPGNPHTLSGATPGKQTLFQKIKSEIEAMSKELGLQQSVHVGVSKEGIVISLAGNLLFYPGDVQLKPDAHALLTRLAMLFYRLPNAVRVEGSTDDLNSASSSLVAIQNDLNQQVGTLVTQINTTAQQIAGLNQQITQVKATGQQPNDLEDQRDLLLTQLSSLADIQYSFDTSGNANVSLVGAGSLVSGQTAAQLATSPDATTGLSDVVFQGSTTPLTLTGGQLGGTIAARDQAVGSRLAALDSLAANIASAVNGYQMAGYGTDGSTGIPFFTGTTAATIAVNPTLQRNLAQVAAAAAPNSPGDGSQAQKIAQLQEQPAPGQTSTLQTQYGTLISQLGVDAQQAQTNVQTGQMVLQNLTAQQNSVSGVSLNEEATNLLQYQNAYEASARVISTMAQTISDMIQQLGGH